MEKCLKFKGPADDDDAVTQGLLTKTCFLPMAPSQGYLIQVLFKGDVNDICIFALPILHFELHESPI